MSKANSETYVGHSSSAPLHYKRLLKYGAAALSNTELLTILISNSTPENPQAIHISSRILAHIGGIHELMHVDVDQLMQIEGVSQMTAMQIAAAFEISKRILTIDPNAKPVVHQPKDAIHLIRDMQHLHQEHVRLILLDSNRQVITIPTIYIGTINTSVMRVSEVFRMPIVRGASSIIIAHNHPYGDPTPSPEDIKFTQQLVKAGQLLDIQLVDHLIIGNRDWVSMHDLGLGFE